MRRAWDSFSMSFGVVPEEIVAWNPDYPSANANLQPLFASSEIGSGGFNLGRYHNAEVDRMRPRRSGRTLIDASPRTFPSFHWCSGAMPSCTDQV